MSKTNFSNLSIEHLEVESLQPYKNNPRTHSKEQLEQIAVSIKEFGFTNPILLDDSNGIIAGHGRVEAAKSLKMKQVPCIRLSHMSEVQKRAYIIADNKLAENAGWDVELLSGEIKYISEIDLDFDLTLTGFEAPEIDIMLTAADHVDEADIIPELTGPIVSKPGDLWVLGEHRLLCCDALKASNYKSLMKKETARVVFTDPPYNVPVDGHICGKGKIKHEEFAMASGEMSSEEFTAFLASTFKHLQKYSDDGSLHYICMDWRHIGEILKAGSEYSELKNLCVWNKSNAGMGSLYRSKHELVFVFKNGTAKHINNIELGKHGRNRSNVWDYAGINSFEEDRMDNLAMHPTVKPVAMIQDAIMDSSNRGDIVLDCFGGSGSTLIAAELSGRKARLMELDPKYVDVTIERFQKETGIDAVNEKTGETYDSMKEKANV